MVPAGPTRENRIAKSPFAHYHIWAHHQIAKTYSATHFVAKPLLFATLAFLECCSCMFVGRCNVQTHISMRCTQHTHKHASARLRIHCRVWTKLTKKTNMSRNRIWRISKNNQIQKKHKLNKHMIMDERDGQSERFFVSYGLPNAPGYIDDLYLYSYLCIFIFMFVQI